ncbi:MAG: hypothetical protein EA400_13910 [Chromatiaceae bacterium]|nr:MAG: hypothetical protein EA400_13910 [Chromatiaceae bacterium]
MQLTLLLLAALLAVTCGPAVAGSDADTPARSARETDLQAGAVMFRQCALCHGQHGQGIIGGKYPRIGGLPDYYLLKALRDYKTGERGYDAMLVVGGLKHADEAALADLAAYIAAIEVQVAIPTPEQGNIRKGDRLFRNDCRTCHGRAAQGMERKESPPLVGQYHEYLLRQIGLFRTGHRVHANDPEDDTFVAYDEEDLRNIIAYIVSLNPKPEPIAATP